MFSDHINIDEHICTLPLGYYCQLKKLMKKKEKILYNYNYF